MYRTALRFYEVTKLCINIRLLDGCLCISMVCREVDCSINVPWVTSKLFVNVKERGRDR